MRILKQILSTRDEFQTIQEEEGQISHREDNVKRKLLGAIKAHASHAV